MRNLYLLLFLAFILTSCVPVIRYIGQTRPATQKVDVFITEQRISRPFEYIGKGYINTALTPNPEVIQQKAVEKARVVGADAIIISDYIISGGVATITSSQRSDSVGKSLITTGNSVVTPNISTGFQILFLRYTN